MRKIFILLLILVLVAVGVYAFNSKKYSSSQSSSEVKSVAIPKIDNATMVRISDYTYELTINGEGFSSEQFVFAGVTANAAGNFFSGNIPNTTVTVSKNGTQIVLKPIHTGYESFPVRIINDIDSFLFSRPGLVTSNEVIVNTK